ncbi:hypothetical protein Tco_0803292 [Tanacetum coccineum]|uniref:Retroviral polymerase SH3-like domain-containing protein n=1 Tax=Tanacetum coccineum TaxID=301880 RepID=A0ABQ5A157_9ASTR
MTHPSPKRNMVPKAVLMRSGLVSLTNARPVNTAQTRTTMNTRPKAVVNDVRPKAVLNAAKGNQVNAVKASACWVWKPKTKDKGVIDSGCSRHMTGNMSYLTDYEEIHGGYVAFGGCENGLSSRFKAMNLFVDEKRLSLYGKADEGFFVGYSINSKAFRVFNSRTRIVEENLHVQFSENTPYLVQLWSKICLFDIDALTKSMNYKPVVARNQPNGNAGTKACYDAGMETVPVKDYILLPLWNADPPFSQSSKSSPNAGFKPLGDDEKKVTEEPGKEGGDSSKDSESNDQEKKDNIYSTNTVNTASTNKWEEGGEFVHGVKGLAVKKVRVKNPWVVVVFKTGRENRLYEKEDVRRDKFSPFGKEMSLDGVQKHVMMHVKLEGRHSPDAGFKPSGDNEKKVTKEPRKKGSDSSNDQEKEDDNVNSTNNVNTASDGNITNNVNAVSSTVNAAGIEVNVVGAKTSIELPDGPTMPELEDIVYSDDDEDVGAEADMNNLDAFMLVSPIPTTRIHKNHPVEQIIGDLNSAPQTRKMTKNLEEHGLFSSVQQRTNLKDFQNCLFAC